MVDFLEDGAERLTVLNIANIAQTKLFKHFLIGARHQLTTVVVCVRYRGQLEGGLAVHLSVDEEGSGETTGRRSEVGRLPILPEPGLVRLRYKLSLIGEGVVCSGCTVLCLVEIV